MKLSRSLKLLTLVASFLSPTLGAIAVTNQVSPKAPSSPEYISLGFPPTPSGQERITGGTGGGGTRIGGGGCVAQTQIPSLTPLTPKNQIGKTLNAHPSVFLYVPATKAKLAEFVVIDTNGNYVYTQQFDLPDQSGIVKITLPETNQQGESLSLEQDQTYLWEFAIVCDPSDRSSDVYAWGTLNRLQADPGLQETLNSKQTPLEKAQVYAQNYIWHETLETVAQIRNSQPQEWQELLKSIDIEEERIITAPLIELKIDSE